MFYYNVTISFLIPYFLSIHLSLPRYTVLISSVTSHPLHLRVTSLPSFQLLLHARHLLLAYRPSSPSHSLSPHTLFSLNLTPTKGGTGFAEAARYLDHLISVTLCKKETLNEWQHLVRGCQTNCSRKISLLYRTPQTATATPLQLQKPPIADARRLKHQPPHTHLRHSRRSPCTPPRPHTLTHSLALHLSWVFPQAICLLVIVARAELFAYGIIILVGKVVRLLTIFPWKWNLAESNSSSK